MNRSAVADRIAALSAERDDAIYDASTAEARAEAAERELATARECIAELVDGWKPEQLGPLARAFLDRWLV